MDLRTWSKNIAAVFVAVAVTFFVWHTLCAVADQPYFSDHACPLDAFSQIVPKPGKPIQQSAQLYPTWWGKPPNIPPVKACSEAGTCVKCHKDNATMDEAHAISCVCCHKGDHKAEEKQQAHKGLIPAPGDLTHVHETCGTCHPDEIKKVKRSPMALALRMINHTRFAFGAQKDSMPRFGVKAEGSLKQIPLADTASNLADDLLRRSCLRCHLHTRGSKRWGEHRGMGCSACHTAYANNSDGKPKPHAIVKNVGMTACLKCHNSNHVGADYVGLFEKDFNRGFRSPFVKGKQPPRIYGSEQHRLAADLHFAAGMDCMDCHTLREVHGSGEISNSPGNNVRISCESCHVTGDHPNIVAQQDGTRVLTKSRPPTHATNGTTPSTGGGRDAPKRTTQISARNLKVFGDGSGKDLFAKRSFPENSYSRTVPKWDPKTIPHSIEEHRKRLSCIACHAAWSFQDYGFHLILEEWADYWKWAPNAMQNDPQVQALLRENVGTKLDLVPPPSGEKKPKPMDLWKPPKTKDWLTGELRPGAWYRGYTARRWERPPLGVGSDGKISIMRPMYQYVVSHVDSTATIIVDRHIPKTGSGKPALIWNPYTPHTTSRIGRTCHECHGSPKAIGLGEGLPRTQKPGFVPIWRPESQIPGYSFRWDALVDEKGTALQFSTHSSAGPLDPETVKRLLHPSNRHRAYWARYLRRDPTRP